MNAFVDSNVLVRHLTGDPPDQARRSTEFLRSGETLILADLVVAEVVYVLESVYEVERVRVAELVRAVVGFPAVVVADEGLLLRTLEIYEQYRIHFAESYLAASAELSGVGVVASFDRDIDRVPTVRSPQYCCKLYAMPSRRQRRKLAAARHRHVKSAPAPELVGDLVLATSVERLAYTREQAAEALGLSLATLDRRIIPVIATVLTESHRRLIPVAELERYLADRTEQPRAAPKPRVRPGRKTGLPTLVVARILDEHQAGGGFAEIARALNRDRVPTAQAGRQWWPSTVRAVIDRSSLQRPAGPSATPSRLPPQA